MRNDDRIVKLRHRKGCEIKNNKSCLGSFGDLSLIDKKDECIEISEDCDKNK